METSQRIVDVLFRAFSKALPTRIPAASTGSMNNMAVGGFDPVRGRAYSLRRGSGGTGRHPGGDGLVRELEFLTGTECTLLTERRRISPYGLKGGGGGNKGRNLLIRNGRTIHLPGKVGLRVHPGDRIRMETTGGGGFGRK